MFLNQFLLLAAALFCIGVYGVIARKNGVTSREVALYNPKVRKLKSGNLPAGTMVLVPTKAVGSAAVSVPDPEIERYGSSSSTASTTHLIKHGETLGGIAKRYGTSTEALMRLNGLKKPLIFAGQTLLVKGKKATVKKAPARKSTARKSTAKKSSAKKATGKKK